MKDQLLDVLTAIGLGEKESQIYLTLLESGPSTIVDVSRKSGIKRTTVHEVMKSLSGLALVAVTTAGKRKQYLAESPDKLVEEKSRELDLLRTAMPELESRRNQSSEKPAIKFFQGREGMKQVFRDLMLKTDPHETTLEIETHNSTQIERLGEPFLRDVIERRKRRGGKSLVVVTSDRDSLERSRKESPWIFDQPMEVRILPDQKRLFRIGLYAYQNKVAFVVPDHLLALVIQDQRLKEAAQWIFESLWNASEFFCAYPNRDS